MHYIICMCSCNYSICSFCRHIKHEIRQLKSLVPLRSDEGTCPACSQVTCLLVYMYVLHGLLMKYYNYTE